jgi:hypothetical protein
VGEGEGEGEGDQSSVSRIQGARGPGQICPFRCGENKALVRGGREPG